MEYGDELFEIIESGTFIAILKQIGIDLDLVEQDCLLSVLQKPDLNKHISIQELEEIMESVNLELNEMTQSRLQQYEDRSKRGLSDPGREEGAESSASPP